MDAPVVQILGAATALFLSTLILSAVLRQATKRSFQKRAFLVSAVLLITAVVSNIVLTIVLNPASASDPAASASALILAKKVQATIDFLFAITIGAFVLATVRPEIDSWRAFIGHMRDQFPNAFLFYVFVQGLAIIVVWISAPTIPIPPFPDVTRIVFPPTFLFTLGLAGITVVAYVPFLLLSYVRRIHARPSVARDVYFIILGVVGYTVTEMVIEIVLPVYAIDVRAPGFIWEMVLLGVISFAARERGFLDELLIPQTEAQATTAPAYDVQRGLTYLVLEDTPNHSFEMFRDFVTHGAQGLCITRKAPKIVMEAYGLEKTPILWLSRVATQKNSIRPSPPENVALAVEHFIGVGKEAVVLLDGLEYLVAHNDFSSVLALLHDLNESVSLSESILLLPVDARAFNEREFALLKREVEVIVPPGDAAKAPQRVEVELAKAAKRAY